ncbi:MAG: pentapeptide repeat-containing protein [Solirubrobacteraceae bacterium]
MPTARSPEPPRTEEPPLDGVDLADGRGEELRVVDLVVAGANLANLRAARSRGERLVVRRSRLTGATFAEGRLADVTFAECGMDLVSFASCGLERVTFEDCVLTGADLQEARMRDVRLHRCDLTDADLRGARLTTCELRGCTLDGLRGAEALRGAAMEWSDVVAGAGTWAAALGIEILDGDPQR